MLVLCLFPLGAGFAAALSGCGDDPLDCSDGHCVTQRPCAGSRPAGADAGADAGSDAAASDDGGTCGPDAGGEAGRPTCIDLGGFCNFDEECCTSSCGADNLCG